MELGIGHMKPQTTRMMITASLALLSLAAFALFPSSSAGPLLIYAAILFGAFSVIFHTLRLLDDSSPEIQTRPGDKER